METQNTTTAQEPKPVRGQGVLEWYEALISAALVLVLVFSFFFRIIQVDGSSMVPTLVNGDKLIVWGAGYTPQRGDVVIVDSYTSYGKPLVKRVIAKGGDTISIDYDSGMVMVNGEVLQEDYIAEPTYLGYDVTFPYTVPEGTVFVMGDNRNQSLDSRSTYVGCIDERDILGRVLLCFMPFTDFGAVIPHHKQGALRHCERELHIVAQIGRGCNVVLLQKFAVHRDRTGIVINADGVAALGNDPLDQRLTVDGVAVHDDHIAPLWGVACRPDDKLIAVGQGGHHRASIHLNDAEEKRKDQYQHQRCGDERFVPFQHALPAYSGGRLLLFFHSLATSLS